MSAASRDVYPPRHRPTLAERALGAVLMALGAGFEIVRRVRARRFTGEENTP